MDVDFDDDAVDDDAAAAADDEDGASFSNDGYGERVESEIVDHLSDGGGGGSSRGGSGGKATHYQMVAFEVYGKVQIRRFFCGVWFLLLAGLVYASIMLGFSVDCLNNDSFGEAFRNYVTYSCTSNLGIPPGFSPDEYWAFCCAPFDGVGNVAGGCFTNSTYGSCCTLTLATALNKCTNRCNLQAVDSAIRMFLGFASVVGLLTYVVVDGADAIVVTQAHRQAVVTGAFALCCVPQARPGDSAAVTNCVFSLRI